MLDQADLLLIRATARGDLLHAGRTRRLATPTQRLALALRDRGCSFPGCRRPPSRCQAHHLQAWLDLGPTDIDNLTLLCEYHHATFQRTGWECLLIHGTIHWKPPQWLDPDRIPIRNTAHDTGCVPTAGTRSKDHGIGLSG